MHDARMNLTERAEIVQRAAVIAESEECATIEPEHISKVIAFFLGVSSLIHSQFSAGSASSVAGFPLTDGTVASISCLRSSLGMVLCTTIQFVGGHSSPAIHSCQLALDLDSA